MTVSVRTPRPNFTEVQIGSLTVWFSYRTPIAFEIGGELTIRENDWGPTTGKHLNAVSEDKSRRIPGDQFTKALAGVLPEDVDYQSSASRQHFIDTGRYLRHGEAEEV